MYATTKISRGTVIIYYEKDRKPLRIATGVGRIITDDKINGNDKSNKYFKNGYLTAKVPDYQNKNDIISVKLEQVNEIIKDYFFANKEKPSIEFVKSALKQGKQEIKSQEKKYEGYEDFFLLMYEEKKLDAIVPSSLKDYTSTLNALRLYQHLYGELTLETMNSEAFIKRFESFLAQRHKGIDLKKFKTCGGLNVNTTKKRISTLLTFLKWCDGKGIIKRKFEVENYKTKLKKYQPTVVKIDKDEKKKLIQLELTGDEEKLRDILVFLCLVGIRYSDLLMLHAGFFQNGYIVKEAEKTDLLFKVPMTKKAIEIAEKYNYTFNFFTTTMFNRLIKVFLKKYNICCYPIKIKNVIFNKTEYVTVDKYTQIGSHTGRRSFIANCILNGYTIPAIMAMTGHSKISSLQCYIDQFQVQEDAINKIQLLD